MLSDGEYNLLTYLSYITNGVSLFYDTKSI